MRLRDPSIRAAVFDGFDTFLQGRGATVSLRELLADQGLTPDALEAPETALPLRAVAQIFERAAIVTGLPCFGIEFAGAYPVGASGALGFLLTQAPTMLDALQGLAQYIHAFTTPMHIGFVREGGVGYLEWKFPIEFSAAMPQYVSFALATIIHRLRHVAGSDWVPLQVELIHRELTCPDLYRPVFGPRVRFNAAYNRMWIDATTLARRHDNPNLRLYRTARVAAEAERADFVAPAADDIVSRLRDHLRGVLATGELELDTVAAGLGLEARSLQYDLEQAGTTYSDELSATRRLVAEQLLATTEQSMTEIATALGFAELSSFTRACRVSWFGMSPSKFRARVRAEGSFPRPSASPDPEDTGA
jgi:AraC-like DNA-binding protein